jgi:molecular chaperone HscB
MTQPEMPQDYFAFFDLPRKLAIDSKDLEKRFYALSRRHHPDVHARKGAEALAEAEQAAALLNDAYRTLRDPIARASYLLKLEGFEIGEQTTKDVPPELLEEIFELNMELEENPDSKAGERFHAMRDDVDREIERAFDQWDEGGNRDTLTELRGLLNRRKYISNLIDKTNVSDRV